MIYLYHAVPKDLQGNILYPLNVLKEKYPELYNEKIKKYAGREQVMEFRIFPLNCLWNDALHFAAVHPSEVRKALVEAGRADRDGMSFYQIDPNLLDSKNTTVYLYNQVKREKGLREDNFTAYNPDDLEKYSTMPQETKDHYKEKVSRGERPLLFHKVPHILYKGTLDVSNLPIITV